MKQINNLVCKAIILLVIIVCSVKASAQCNHSQVVSFMQDKGWVLSADNNFAYANASKHTTLQYYNFDSSRKYAIVAFSRNKDVKDFDLEIQKDNGSLYNKKYNTRLIPQIFNTRFDAAIYCFNPAESVRLGIKITMNSSNPEHSSQCHYMIFYK